MAFTSTPTTKYRLRKITGSSDRAEIDDGIGALADDIDANMAGYAQGTLAAIPGAGKAGRFYRTTDTTQLFVDTGAAWLEVGISPWAPGDLKASWLTVAPVGWLVCDGSAVSRATYATLYAAIGDSAGAGNGSTTFNVPDYRGRAFVMPDGSAGRMASNDARGQSGGAELTTLVAANLPSGMYVTTSAGATQKDDGAGALANPSGSVTGSSTPFENMGPYLVGGSIMIKT